MPRILTQADIANFRGRLCDAAAQLFIELGHGGFNMRELAKRLGVSAMTPYRYFKDKDEILAAVKARAFARFADWLETAQAEAPEDRNVLGRAYAQFALQEQTQYRLMFDISRPQTVIFPDLVVQEQRVQAVMAGPGSLENGANLSGQLFWSALHGVVTLYLAGKLSAPQFDRVLSEALHIRAGAPSNDFGRQSSLTEKWPALPVEQMSHRHGEAVAAE